MKYQLIVFDWDGTLMDSEARIVACMQQAACDLGVPVPSDHASKDVIGLGLMEAVQRLFQGQEAEHWPLLEDAYRRHFLANELAPSPLFDGARAVIQGLAEQDCFLAVATGKSRRGLDRVLEETGLGPVFHATRCTDETFSKPHPQMLMEIMGYLGVVAADTLMVGDTEYDVQMAKNAGADALGVGYGVHEPERLYRHGALHCLQQIRELPDWLAQQTISVTSNIE